MVSPAAETSPLAVETISDHDLLGLSETNNPAKNSPTNQAISAPITPIPSLSIPPLSASSSLSSSPLEPQPKSSLVETPKSQSSSFRSLSDLPSETNSAIGWTNPMPSPTASDDTHTLFTGQTANQDLLQALSVLLTSGGLATPTARLEPHRRRNVVVCLANPEDVRVVEEVLGAQEYEITVASSPEQVTSMLQTSHLLDILLLDPNFHAGQHGGAMIMRYLNMLNPARRRRVFVVVTSQAYRTQDLQAAFVHGVNLVVNTSDLAALPNVLAKSIQDFNDLYRAFNEVNGISAF